MKREANSLTEGTRAITDDAHGCEHHAKMLGFLTKETGFTG